MKHAWHVGDRVLIHPGERYPQWFAVTIIKIELTGSNGGPYQFGDRDGARVYTFQGPEKEFRDAYGRRKDTVSFNESEVRIVSARRNPWRDCWRGGDIELTDRSEVQLFCYDFGLDGTDNEMRARIEGTFVSGPSGTDHAQHAMVVFDLSAETMSQTRVSVNLWRLLDFGVDTASLWEHTGT